MNSRVCAEAVPAEEGGASTWAEWSIRDRLVVLRDARHALAERTAELAAAINPTLARSRADTLVAEALPLLAACKFLEKEASRILQSRRLGLRGRPIWLGGVASSVERVPLGKVLVIGPANYPLFLPGVQVLQALAAGNTVIWKPGLGGRAVAEVVHDALRQVGLPAGVLRVTGESVAEGVEAMRRGVDKVFFTGSSAGGRAVLRAAAETVTPVVVELSGCDAVVVLASADSDRVLAALEFGMRLNGSATCMAPRRLMLVGDGHEALISALRTRFAEMEGVLVGERVRGQLQALVEEAAAKGARVGGDVRALVLKPLLVLNATPDMQVTQTDVFAPILCVMSFKNAEEMLSADAVCPFGLTAAIFGEEREARRLGDRMKVGTVLVNDIIVPTADPRVPFCGRRGSGFGATRGAEGLLEMTAIKTVLVRRGKAMRHFEATGKTHEEMFAGVLGTAYGGTWEKKYLGLRRILAAVKKLKAEKR